MQLMKRPSQMPKLISGKMLILFALSVWYPAVYWSLAGEGLYPFKEPNVLFQEGRGLLRGFLVIFLIWALMPVLLGLKFKFSESRRRRFVLLVSLLVFGNLILEAIERNLPVQGIVVVAFFYLMSVGILVRAESVRDRDHDG